MIRGPDPTGNHGCGRRGEARLGGGLARGGGCGERGSGRGFFGSLR